MIEWNACKDKMPTERGEYLLYSEEYDRCLGLFPWIPDAAGKDGIWCDLFATREAGEAYGPPLVSHWAVWNAPKAGTSS